jgi:serine/threonine protein kinase
MSAGDLEANVEVGDFRIVKRLGSGGMGIVYQARQISLNRIVALKVLGGALTQEGAIARFRREAQAAAKLHHPNIATVYFVGQDRHTCYMAMEYIEGATLREVMDQLASTRDPNLQIDSIPRGPHAERENNAVLRFDLQVETTDAGPPPPENSTTPALSPVAERVIATEGYIRRCCELIRDVAHALDHAHKQGVVHRDIKPANLLLDRDGLVHLIDFGIARFYEDMTVTNTGQLVGTPMYMSPEQVTGRLALDHRTDIYSLGLVLYELLTLRPPILARARDDLLRKIVTKTMPPLRWGNGGVGQDLESVVHKAIARDPDQRYESATAFAGDLQQYLDGSPVTALPYRHQFDASEVAGVRPGAVVATAVFFFSVAGLFLMQLLAMAGQVFVFGIGAMGHALMLNAIIIPPLVIMLYVGGRGMLAGKLWSRWVGLAAILVIILLAAVAIGQRFQDGRISPYLTYTAIVLAPVVVCSSLSAYVLLQRRTRDWFHFAAKLREEHQRQRQKLRPRQGRPSH